MRAAGFTVAITPKNFDAEAERYLVEAGCSPLHIPLPEGCSDGDLDEDALAAALSTSDAWIVGHAHVTASLLRRLPRLKVVCRRGVGHERVDARAVAALGKAATVAVGGNDAAVADHAVGLMLAVARRHRECQMRLARGEWFIPIGTDLFRKTVGVIGPGRIGRGVAARLAGFECRVLLCGRNDGGTSLDHVLEEADFITLHMPLTSQTRFLIGEGAIVRMKRTAILINTARGGLVDDAALLRALQEGRLGGAGLDVFASESDPAYAPVTQALLQLPNVVATPHSAGSTRESLQKTNLVAARCAVAALHGAPLDPSCVVADGRSHRSG